MNILKFIEQLKASKLYAECGECGEEFPLSKAVLFDGLGDFLTEPQKDWARAKLKSETIFLLKARLESEK